MDLYVENFLFFVLKSVQVSLIMKQSTLFLLCLLFCCFEATGQVKLTVNHTETGQVSAAITAALGTTSASAVTELAIAGTANLNYDDCAGIGTVFNTTTLKILDLSAAHFDNDSIPRSGTTGAFNGMKMETVVLPATLKAIGDRGFRNCTSLRTINFPETLRFIGIGAFVGCAALEANNELPSGIITLGFNAFQNCTKLNFTKLPDELSGAVDLSGKYLPGVLANNSFSGTKVAFSSIPYAITDIGNSAFSKSAITNMTFPVGFKSLRAKVFENCKLTNIVFNDTIPPTVDLTDDNHSFKGVSLPVITLQVPEVATEAYNIAPWDQMVGAEPFQNPTTFTTTYAGRNRKYLLYKPQNNAHRKPDGILVTCHGFGGKMENAYQMYGFKQAADEHNLIIISPQALPEEDQTLQTTANLIGYDLTAVWGKVLYVDVSLIKQTLNRNVDDVAYIRNLIQQVAVEHEANINNTFIGGISMGGYMSYAYALKHGNELSGLINVVGTMGLNLDTANVAVSLPILDFHSTTDEVVFYTGSGKYNGMIQMTNGIGKEKVLNYWSRKNNTVSPPEITNLGTNKNVSIKKYYYDHPINEITHYQLTGAPHSYTLSVGNGDAVSHAAEVKSFVKKHLNKTNTAIPEKKTSTIEMYPSVVENDIYIKGVEHQQKAYIFNIYGQIVKTLVLDPVENQSVSFAGFPVGLYWIKTDEITFKFIKR